MQSNEEIDVTTDTQENAESAFIAKAIQFMVLNDSFVLLCTTIPVEGELAKIYVTPDNSVFVKPATIETDSMTASMPYIPVIGVTKSHILALEECGFIEMLDESTEEKRVYTPTDTARKVIDEARQAAVDAERASFALAARAAVDSQELSAALEQYNRFMGRKGDARDVVVP